MNILRWLPLFTIAVLISIAMPAWAGTKSSDSQKVTIDLASTTTVNNTTLKSGEYTVVVEGDKAKFEQDGKVVAQASCTWKPLTAKPPYTQVLTDQSRITEIDISGKTQAIQFAS